MSVIAIFGPTASGKSAVAQTIAERIPATLISADSAQLYRDLPVLTNQPTVPTELVAVFDLMHEVSVAEYQRLAHRAIDRALAGGRTPIVVGGTGLYLRAALSDLRLPSKPAPGGRERWLRTYDSLGASAAHELLAQRDPAAAARIHPNDRRRVVRGLELAEAGESLNPAHDQLWSEEMRQPTLLIGLDVPREELHRRIEARTVAQFHAGIEDEVRRALERPLSSTARKVMGLEEIATLPRTQAMDVFALRNRQYAAYQRKWMRRIPGLVRVAADRPTDEIADEILELACARQRLPAHRGVGAHP